MSLIFLSESQTLNNQNVVIILVISLNVSLYILKKSSYKPLEEKKLKTFNI